MWTRHLTRAVVDWKTKVSQYWQWDGYPEWQWVEILDLLRKVDLEILKEKVSWLYFAPWDLVDKLCEAYRELKRDIPPEYHRDTWGAGVLRMVYDWDVKWVPESNSEWCEGIYTIDFDDNKFIVEYYWEKEFNLDNLPTNEEFLKLFQEKEE